jgi:hypothetical protein
MMTSAIDPDRALWDQGFAMHDTEQASPRPVAPFASEAMPNLEPSHDLTDRTPVPPEVIVKLMGLIDEAERLVGDPDEAWAALRVMIDDRKARRESRRTADDVGPTEPVRREPRPFTGFDREIATYERIKPAMLERAEGKWVTIVGEEVIGPLDDMEEAVRAGYRRFGLGPLYVKQILAQEPPPVVLPPYLVVPCQT